MRSCQGSGQDVPGHLGHLEKGEDLDQARPRPGGVCLTPATLLEIIIVLLYGSELYGPRSTNTAAEKELRIDEYR